MKASAQDEYDELAYYTLSHSDPSFIHQHVVDAFAVQHADGTTKPIAIAFGLIGLYLYLERDLTGRQIQGVHVQLARRRKTWPRINLPALRGDLTGADVLAVPPGVQRDQMIRQWCASVWSSMSEIREDVMKLIPDDLSIG